jgi:hypothetical protein
MNIILGTYTLSIKYHCQVYEVGARIKLNWEMICHILYADLGNRKKWLNLFHSLMDELNLPCTEVLSGILQHGRNQLSNLFT